MHHVTAKWGHACQLTIDQFNNNAVMRQLYVPKLSLVHLHDLLSQYC